MWFERERGGLVSLLVGFKAGTFREGVKRKAEIEEMKNGCAHTKVQSDTMVYGRKVYWNAGLS